MAAPIHEPYVGARKEIAFTKESVRGTKATAVSGNWQPHEGFDFKPMVTKIRDEAAVGHIGDILNSHLHQISSEGSVPMRFTKDFVGHLFNMMMGQVPTTTSLGGGFYRHVWSLKNTNRHVSYTITVFDPVRGFLAYPLGIGNEFSFEFNTESIAKVALGLLAGAEEVAVGVSSTGYDTIYEYPFFMPQHITAKIADTLAGLDAASALDVEGLPLTVAKNAAKRFKLGQAQVADNINQRFGSAGTIEAVYDKDYFRALAHANVKKALGIYFDDGEGNKVEFEWPRVTFEDWSSTEDNNAWMKNSTPWFAELSTSEGMFQVAVENKVSSYA